MRIPWIGLVCLANLGVVTAVSGDTSGISQRVSVGYSGRHDVCHFNYLNCLGVYSDHGYWVSDPVTRTSGINVGYPWYWRGHHVPQGGCRAIQYAGEFAEDSRPKATEYRPSGAVRITVVPFRSIPLAADWLTCETAGFCSGGSLWNCFSEMRTASIAALGTASAPVAWFAPEDCVAVGSLPVAEYAKPLAMAFHTPTHVARVPIITGGEPPIVIGHLNVECHSDDVWGFRFSDDGVIRYWATRKSAELLREPGCSTCVSGAGVTYGIRTTTSLGAFVFGYTVATMGDWSEFGGLGPEQLIEELQEIVGQGGGGVGGSWGDETGDPDGIVGHLFDLRAEVESAIWEDALYGWTALFQRVYSDMVYMGSLSAFAPQNHGASAELWLEVGDVTMFNTDIRNAFHSTPGSSFWTSTPVLVLRVATTILLLVGISWNGVQWLWWGLTGTGGLS